jgi:hypothetical protein
MYRLTISERGSNNPPMVEQDFESQIEALADFTMRIVDLNDPTVVVRPAHPSTVIDMHFVIEADSFANDDSVNVEHEARIVWVA